MKNKNVCFASLESSAHAIQILPLPWWIWRILHEVVSWQHEPVPIRHAWIRQYARPLPRIAKTTLEVGLHELNQFRKNIRSVMTFVIIYRNHH